MSPQLVRVLHQGDVGFDVVAVKRAQVKLNGGKNAGVNVDLQSYGPAAVALLDKQRAMCKLPPSHLVDQAFWHFLAPYVDLYGQSLLEKEREALEPRKRFLAIADQTVIHHSLFDYTERIGEGPGERDWFRVAQLPDLTVPANWAQIHTRLSCDCSAHFVGCGEHAGIPSTVARGVMDSDAATGALLEDLDRISLGDAEPGDGVIWVGPRSPAGVHVAILRTRLGNDWRLVNHGGQGDPNYSTLSAQQAWHARYMNAPTQVVVRLPA